MMKAHFLSPVWLSIIGALVILRPVYGAWGIYEVGNQLHPVYSFACSGYGPAASEEFLYQYKWDSGEGKYVIFGFTRRSPTADAGEIVTGAMGEDWESYAYAETPNSYPIGSYKLQIVEGEGAGEVKHDEPFLVFENP